MDPLQTLDYALGELRQVIAGIDDTEMDLPTNCEPSAGTMSPRTT